MLAGCSISLSTSVDHYYVCLSLLIHALSTLTYTIYIDLPAPSGRTSKPRRLRACKVTKPRDSDVDLSGVRGVWVMSGLGKDRAEFGHGYMRVRIKLGGWSLSMLSYVDLVDLVDL